jgi:hypothetical protein
MMLLFGAAAVALVARRRLGKKDAAAEAELEAEAAAA